MLNALQRSVLCRYSRTYFKPGAVGALQLLVVTELARCQWPTILRGDAASCGSGRAWAGVLLQRAVVQVLLYTPRRELEPEALQQLIAVAESPLPADDSFVAAMPDVHLGKGVTIGTVFASALYVCPNAVGVDIGAFTTRGCQWCWSCTLSVSFQARSYLHESRARERSVTKRFRHASW